MSESTDPDTSEPEGLGEPFHGIDDPALDEADVDVFNPEPPTGPDPDPDEPHLIDEDLAGRHYAVEPVGHGTHDMRDHFDREADKS